jgi:hypothetical protein
LVGQRFLFRDCGPDEMFMSVCVVTTVAIVMFLKNFWPYVIIFLNVCLVITVAIDMMLTDFGPYGINLINVCVIITVSIVMV